MPATGVLDVCTGPVQRTRRRPMPEGVGDTIDDLVPADAIGSCCDDLRGEHVVDEPAELDGLIVAMVMPEACPDGPAGIGVGPVWVSSMDLARPVVTNPGSGSSLLITW